MAMSCCRLCAEKCQPGVDSVDLFGPPKAGGWRVKIRKYLRIELNPTEGLPRLICHPCRDKLVDIQKFSLLVRRTQVKLSAKDDLQLEAATHKALENAVQPTDTSSILHAILSQASTAPKKSTPVKKVITLPPPLVPISSLTATSTTASTTPAPVIKEEPYDASYEVVNIKPEPLDPPGEDEYVLPDTERPVDVKEEPVDEEEVVDQEDMEELVEEEDMEVTVDPMMFLYKEDSSDVTIVKQEVESTKLPSPAKSPAKSKAGSIVVKSLEHLKDLKVTKKKTVYDRRKNGPKPYQCAICPRGYYSDIGLQNHLWSHRKILKNSNVVNRDEEKVNWKKTKITASNLLSYNNAMFSSGTRYQCPLCNKKINTKSNLRRHLQAHKPKGKHTCEICFRIFKTEINLTRHLECHDTVELSCPDCNRVYPTNSTLRAHMISHSTERPHNCPHFSLEPAHGGASIQVPLLSQDVRKFRQLLLA
ncbi:hypothetical protein M8J76_000224 [Diaphorina citri]|nr:hypothetical protein M8J76_000224 [Diaphorina citri]